MSKKRNLNVLIPKDNINYYMINLKILQKIERELVNLKNAKNCFFLAVIYILHLQNFDKLKIFYFFNCRCFDQNVSENFDSDLPMQDFQD